MAKWAPLASEQAYYSVNAPSDSQSIIWACIVRPLLEFLRILSPLADLSYGRYSLPFSPAEQSIRNDPAITVHSAKVHLTRTGTITGKKETGHWVWYQSWLNKKAAKDKNRQADLVVIHGISGYGGAFAKHAKTFLDEGYRLILPDLPSYGRSSGLHGHFHSIDQLVDSIHLCIQDVLEHDRASGIPESLLESRKRFIMGQSLGGYVAVAYCRAYGTSPIEENLAPHSAIPAGSDKRPAITGAFLQSPMLYISRDSRPPKIVELIGRVLSTAFPRLPLVRGGKGKASSDTRVTEEYEANPQNYHGYLRLSAALACSNGVVSLAGREEEFTTPFRLVHGTADRVTDWRGSRRFYEFASSTDKQFQEYPGYEHVMTRVGIDEKDDEPRQRLLADMRSWLNSH